MKMFSDCSGECCVCACSVGCLAGHGDDDFFPASKDQIIDRLDNGRYKDHTEYMKNYLKTYYNYDYDKERASTKQTKTAHWIIEDHGFGGTSYMCSECRESWNDIYHDVSMEDTCPHCGAFINDDDNKYIEDKKKPRIDIPTIPTLHLGKFIKMTDESETIRKYEESVSKLIKISGYDVDKLIELFAAGYTLQPPNYKDLNIL